MALFADLASPQGPATMDLKHNEQWNTHQRTVNSGNEPSAGVSSFCGAETSAALGPSAVPTGPNQVAAGHGAGAVPVFISYSDIDDAKVDADIAGALERWGPAAEEGPCRVGIGYGVGITDGDGDSDELLPRPPASEGVTGSGVEVANTVTPTDALCFRVSERGEGRVALRGLLSGDLIWVSAKRYRAILKRRHQRQRGIRIGIGGLTVFSSPCNGTRGLTSFRAQAASMEQQQEELQLLQLNPRQVQPNDDPQSDYVQEDYVVDIDDDYCHGNSCGDEDESADISDGGVGGSSCACPTLDSSDERHPATAVAAGGAAAPAVVTALQWGFVPLAAPAAMMGTALAKAALEAELRAVLAEETGVLAPDPSVDDSTAGALSADDGSRGGGNI
ncbi:hypothetical protein VOLCADRAFT_90425 [Volvox carteri f. nagariensis]|uniref:Uncharacterized protein n=1 Tax=Volvox carteri f. nagariensis TaxID=3068 RepID=D8TUC2_VOLCA|nr:uncharacterized protein VOLCADRAFT_90425 [Volvox carteri f. nagariensis]EFJ49013.1 hypothetical protein VOLCADRAFT_90425 [Volvox carteri f. nagariensis]|eukprot:XP_002949910.1 hypothetical protein VOLCADRAFT_90425 [Volvox carteri f. nagariensis]